MIKIADGYVDVGLEDHTDRDLDKILAKLRAAGEKRGIPIGVDDETARPLREIDAKLKTWTATHTQTVQVKADTAGIERASLAVRRAALSSKAAQDQAARASRAAAAAAEKLKGDEEQAAAAQLAAADAAGKLERGEIKEAEAKRAAAQAAQALERAEKQAARATDLKAKASLAAEKAELSEAAAASASAQALERQGKAADHAAEQQRQLARDLELTAAAQSLASLKAAGAVRQHNSEVMRLRKEMPELGKASEGAFDLMTSGTRTFGRGLDNVGSSLSELSGLGRAVPGLIIAGLELLPAVAAAAGGAITLGLGGAFAAVGIIAASKNQQIKEQYSSLGKEIFGHLQEDARPFQATITHVGTYLEDELRSWRPLVHNAFAEMAPEVDIFAKQGIHSLEEFKPAFTSIIDGFGVQLRGLGPELPGITHNIAVGLQAIGDAAQKNPKALADMAHNLSLVVRAGGDVIGFFTRFEGQINQATVLANAFAVGPVGLIGLGLYKLKSTVGGGGGGMFDQLTKSLQGTTGSADSAASSMTTTGMATEHLLSSQKIAAMTSDQLKAALDRLTGANQSGFDAQTAYANALNEASAQAKKSNAGFDGNSKAIQQNRAALSQLSQAFKNDLAGKTPAEIDKMRDSFIHAAEGMGASKKRAKELADELLGVAGATKKIPDKKTTKLDAKDDTKPGVDSAKKNTNSFTDKIWRAQITAQNKVGGAVSAAAGAAKRFAGGAYRANLTALNKTGGVVSSATSMARRFAGGAYRAALTANNAAVSAFNSAMSLGRSWASRVFTATFNVIKKINPFATGGYIGGYADGGPIQSYPNGGPVHGPGTETSDSIPIMTTNGLINGSDGEYMVNAKQTKKHRLLLDLINYGAPGFAHGGPIGPGYASGGKITKAQRSSAGSSLVSSIESHLLASLTSIKDVATKVNDAIKKYFSGKTESKMLAWAKNIESQWESAAGKLATLKDKIKEATDYAATAKSNALGTADLSNLGTLGNASDISSGLGFKLQQMQAFSTKISQLAKLGLNKSVLSQIINAGPEQGSAIADMLLKDTSQIQTINTQEAALDKIAGDIGNTAADVMYDSGKDASKGFLAGLKGQQAALEKLMEGLGKKLASGIAKNFKVKKPKKHAAGGIAAAGELALVGEEGPELVSVGTTSRVYTADQTAGMLGGGGGVHIEGGVHVHVVGTFDFSDPKAAELLAEQAAAAIREKIRKLDKAHR